LIFKIEIIESKPGEQFVFQNPYPGRMVILAQSLEQLKKATAWPLKTDETVSYPIAPKAVIYGKVLEDEEILAPVPREIRQY